MSRTLARGRLRVDATRAIGKLREHLLVDQHLYLCELVRCGVAAGAPGIDVQFDADDVIVDLSGLELVPGVLARLFDYLLVDASTPEELRLQRLALGVNAALGLAPHWVDLVHLAPEGCQRVRYTPDLLERGVEPAMATVARPRGAPARGVRVHLRYRVGWNVVVRATSDRRPREVVRLVEAVADLDVPVTCNGDPVRVASRHPLLVVPFDVHGLRRGWVEIGAAGEPTTAEYLEHGVLLVASQWTPSPELTLPPWDGLALPARLVVDALDLPTNASRSALQQESSLIQQAHIEGAEALRRALAALAEIVRGRDVSDPEVVIRDPRPAVIEDALGAIVCSVVAAIRAGRMVAPDLQHLLELPLLRDATGRTIPVIEVLRRGRVSVMRRDEPLPEALAPWVKEVVWLRGRVVERALSGVEEINVSQVQAEAEAGERRRVHLMAHAATEPRVADRPEHVVCTSFSYAEGALAGLVGEVAVGMVDPAVGHPGSTVHVYFEGRLLDTITIPPAALPLCVDVAVQWPQRLLPAWGWDGVMRGHRLDQAIWGAVRAAIDRVGDLTERLSELDPAQMAVVAAIVRAAILTVGLEPSEGDPVNLDDALSVERHRAMRRARVWRLSDGSWASYVQLCQYARRTGALCYVTSGGASARALDGRPVAVFGDDLVRLGEGLGVELVPYGEAIGSPERLAELRRTSARTCQAVIERLAPDPAPTLPLVQGEVRGLVRLAPDGEQVVAVHAGVEVGVVAGVESVPGVVVVIDDDTLVPMTDWGGVLYHSPWKLGAFLRDFAERLTVALEGDTETQAQLELGHPAADLTARVFLLEWLGRIRLERRQRSKRKLGPLDPLTGRIAKLPLVDELDEEGVPRRVSLEEVEKRRRKHLPLLREVPGFATLDWFPIVAEGRLFDAIRSCVPRAVLAVAQLGTRRRQAELDRARRHVMDQPVLAVNELPALADPSTPVVTHHASEAPRASLSVGLPAAPVALDSPCCEVLFDGHPLVWLTRAELGLPVVARVSLFDAELVEQWASLTEDGRELVRLHVAETVKQLMAQLLEHAAARGTWLVENVPVLDLLETLQRTGAWPIATTELARRCGAWPTVQGERVPFGQLRRQGKKLWFGRDRYDNWYPRERGHAPLDEPTLHLPTTPAGLALAATFSAGGYEFVDVTAALARLQEQRAAGGAVAVPRLTGEPDHPDLRVGLTEVDVTEAEGELELTAGEPGVSLIDLEGKTRHVVTELPFPLRAVARVEVQVIDEKVAHRVVQAIARGGARLLDRLAPRLEELPAVAADCSLALFFYRVARSKGAPRALASAPLFPDTQGRRHSFRELVRYAGPSRLGYTELAPPYPEVPPRAPVLRLTAEQAALVAKWLPLDHATNRLKRQLRGEERARVAPRTVVEMRSGMRVQCLVTVRVNADSLSGEVGLLRPSEEALPTVEVLVGRRPLTMLHPEPVWPVTGVVNDDAMEPNQWFDGLQRPGDGQRLLERLGETVRVAFAEWLPAPADACATQWLERVSLGKSATVSGRVWLPGRWPVAPIVDVCHADAPQGVRLTPVTAVGPQLTGAVPVLGHLVVWGKFTHNVQRSLFARLRKLSLELLAAAQGEEAELARYRADLGLLGVDESQSVATAAGGRASWAEVRAELGTHGELWWSDGALSDAAALPAGQAGLIIPHRETAALDVLRHRTTPGALRRLGGEREPAAPPALSSAAPSAPPSDYPGVARWLHEFLLGSHLASSPPSPPQADVPDVLVEALRERLQKHVVLSSHVASIERRPSRRAVRYDARNRLLLLAKEHPVLEAFDGRSRQGRQLLDVLVAAVATEINRALGVVTNASERSVLLALLSGSAPTQRQAKRGG